MLKRLPRHQPHRCTGCEGAGRRASWRKALPGHSGQAGPPGTCMHAKWPPGLGAAQGLRLQGAFLVGFLHCPPPGRSSGSHCVLSQTRSPAPHCGAPGNGGRAGSLWLAAPVSSRDFVLWEPHSSLQGKPRPWESPAPSTWLACHLRRTIPQALQSLEAVARD